MNGEVGTFEAASSEWQTLGDFLAAYADSGVAPEVLVDEFDKLQKMKIWRSEFYTVFVDDAPPHGFGHNLKLWHLSIKRNDREPIMDWRDLQAIKSAIVDPRAEALQLFPAEARVVDTANQYHLFVFMMNGRDRFPMIPVGWTQGQRTDAVFAKAKQRPGAGKVAS